MKATTKYVTVSYCIFRNSGRGGLVGSSDGDKSNGPVTFHHNLYENIRSRTPLLRAATAHSYNNHFNGISSTGMDPRMGGKIKAEKNFFQKARNPLGTFYTNKMGSWDVNDNIWGSGVTWEESEDEKPAGPNPVSTTSISIPYKYSMDDAGCVPKVVAATAGAETNLKVTDGRCKASELLSVLKHPSGKPANVSAIKKVFDILGRPLFSGQYWPFVRP
jgi:pectate lyase